MKKRTILPCINMSREKSETVLSLITTYIIYYIEDITRGCEDMNFIFEWQNNILRTSAVSE